MYEGGESMYNGENNYGLRTYEEQYDAIKGMNTYIAKVFGWMFIGLLLTAAVGFYVSGNIDLVLAIATNPILLFGLFIAEIVMVIVLSARITKLSYGAAIGLFLAYAAINGYLFNYIPGLYQWVHCHSLWHNSNHLWYYVRLWLFHQSRPDPVQNPSFHGSYRCFGSVGCEYLPGKQLH